MILASGEGQLILVVVMAIFGLIKWIGGQLKSTGLPPERETRSGSRPPPANSEEERMRRFLEALGIPSDAPPAPRPNPTVFAPRAGPPPLARVRPMQPPPALPKPPTRRPARRSLEEAPAPTNRAEEIAFSELVTPEEMQVETVAARVSTIPFEKTAKGAPLPAEEMSLSAILRRALASPRDLRAAFVLREVLGPPPGLQR